MAGRIIRDVRSSQQRQERHPETHYVRTWWELKLVCGHVVDRPRPATSGRVACEYCKENQLGGTN